MRVCLIRVCVYIGQYDSVEHFKRLASVLEQSEAGTKGPKANRVFYFAIPPSVFLDVSRCVRTLLRPLWLTDGRCLFAL